MPSAGPCAARDCAAILAMVVVLPTPGGPTNTSTRAWVVSGVASGASALSSTRASTASVRLRHSAGVNCAAAASAIELSMPHAMRRATTPLRAASCLSGRANSRRTSSAEASRRSSSRRLPPNRPVVCAAREPAAQPIESSASSRSSCRWNGVTVRRADTSRSVAAVSATTRRPIQPRQPGADTSSVESTRASGPNSARAAARASRTVEL